MSFSIRDWLTTAPAETPPPPIGDVVYVEPDSGLGWVDDPAPQPDPLVVAQRETINGLAVLTTGELDDRASDNLLAAVSQTIAHAQSVAELRYALAVSDGQIAEIRSHISELSAAADSQAAQLLRDDRDCA